MGKTADQSKKAELDLMFLKNFQAYNLYQKFLAFNIPSNRTGNEAIRKCLFKNAINRRRKEHLKLTKDLAVIKSNLSLIFTSADFFILNKTIPKNCQDIVNVIIKTHDKKLQNLTKNEMLPFRNNEVTTDLSNYHFSDN